jgi:hypothetical protein
VNLQGSKRDRDSEEEDDTEDQTITGGKNVSWIVDSIGIVLAFEKNLLSAGNKTTENKTEYYDVIFFQRYR